jgi:hypothetical protein
MWLREEAIPRDISKWKWPSPSRPWPIYFAENTVSLANRNFFALLREKIDSA